MVYRRWCTGGGVLEVVYRRGMKKTVEKWADGEGKGGKKGEKEGGGRGEGGGEGRGRVKREEEEMKATRKKRDGKGND